MNYRERVKNALLRKETIPTPWQINYTKPYLEMFRQQMGNIDIDDHLENHIYIQKYKKKTLVAPNIEIDLMGVKSIIGNDGGDSGLPIDPPLKNPNFDGYTFPEPDLNFAREKCKALENSDRFRVFGITLFLYERAWALRGTENILMDMLTEEAFTFELFEKIVNYYLPVLDIALQSDIDAFYFSDDWGSQIDLIMGPDLFRKYIKPSLKIICDRIKKENKLIIMHSCGNIKRVLPDLIELGIDCYNTVQPEIYDLKELKREYGKDLSFYGCISNQQFLPYSSSETVYQKCLETMEIMSKGGGYIISPTHAVTPDVPIKNIEAIVRAAKDFSF